MSLESLFGASLSIIVGIDSLNWRMIFGALALLVAVVLPEIKCFHKEPLTHSKT